MAEIGYFAIEDAIKQIFLADERTVRFGDEKTTVEIDVPFNLSAAKIPWIAIYLRDVESPPDTELIGGVNKIRTFITIDIWVYEYAMDHREAARRRDVAYRKVKEVLKANRNLNNKVLITRFVEPHIMTNGLTDKSSFRGALIPLQCEVLE